MPRRLLWTLVAVACTAIVVGGTPVLRAAALGALGALDWRLWGPALASGVGAATVTVTLARRWAARRDARRVATAAGAGTTLHTRADGRRASAVRKLAARGRPVATIARETALAQDAVRDLLGGEEPAPPASAPARLAGFGRSARRGGKLFQPDPARSAAPVPAFADLLREKASRIDA